MKKEQKTKKAEQKLEKLRQKSRLKVIKYQKKMEKIRRRAEKKAHKYATIEKQLIIASKPQVGDPILPEDALLQDFEGASTNRKEPENNPEAVKSKRRERKEREEKEKAERKRIANGDFTLFERFETISFEDLEALHTKAASREERIFYRTVYNLKLQMEQEKVIGEELL